MKGKGFDMVPFTYVHLESTLRAPTSRTSEDTSYGAVFQLAVIELAELGAPPAALSRAEVAAYDDALSGKSSGEHEHDHDTGEEEVGGCYREAQDALDALETDGTIEPIERSSWLEILSSEGYPEFERRWTRCMTGNGIQLQEIGSATPVTIWGEMIAYLENQVQSDFRENVSQLDDLRNPLVADDEWFQEVLKLSPGAASAFAEEQRIGEIDQKCRRDHDFSAVVTVSMMDS